MQKHVGDQKKERRAKQRRSSKKEVAKMSSFFWLFIELRVRVGMGQGRWRGRKQKEFLKGAQKFADSHIIFPAQEKPEKYCHHVPHPSCQGHGRVDGCFMMAWKTEPQELVSDTDKHSMLMAVKGFNKSLSLLFHFHSPTAGIAANILTSFNSYQLRSSTRYRYQKYFLWDFKQNKFIFL